MNSAGSSYYATAVELRAASRRARESYPEALAGGRDRHADNLIRQATAFELAAAVYCLAQAVQDAGENLMAGGGLT